MFLQVIPVFQSFYSLTLCYLHLLITPAISANVAAAYKSVPTLNMYILMYLLLINMSEAFHSNINVENSIQKETCKKPYERCHKTHSTFNNGIVPTVLFK